MARDIRIRIHGKNAVRIALTIKLSQQQVMDELGVGKSMLNQWVTAHHDMDVVLVGDRGLAREHEQHRRKSRILKEERAP